VTGDFEIDDLLHRHGKAIAKSTKLRRCPSPVEQFVRWMFARSRCAAERRAKRTSATFLAGMLFVVWLLCQIAVDNWYSGAAYDEANEIARREYYWKFFKQLKALNRSK
jgi:hypothetical protein